MSANFFLPKKDNAEKTYSLPTAGTFTWTAPNANNDGTPYDITIQMWGAGAGGQRGWSGSSNIYSPSGAGGGAGGWVQCKVRMVVGTVYTFRVGAGGAGAASSATTQSPLVGTAGQSSYISDGGGIIVSANGGLVGTVMTGYGQYNAGGAGASYTASQPAKINASGGSTYFMTGATGGNSRTLSGATSITGSYTNGGNVAPNYGLPGGTGGAANNTAGGGGASPSANGGAGPASGYNAGGAGGAGYYTGGASVAGSHPTMAAGAVGGNGRISFFFTVVGNINGGVAPA